MHNNNKNNYNIISPTLFRVGRGSEAMEAVALFDFTSPSKDELDFKKHDLLIILRANLEKNWSKALLFKKVGLVPKVYFRIKPIPGFMGKISRSDAEKILVKTGINNSFLIRESERCPGDYCLSVWQEGKARHAIIVQNTERLFRIDDVGRFRSLNSLVEHYKHNPISHLEDMKLVHPIPESLKFSVAVTFVAREPTELTIEKGAVVTVEDYSDKNWWVGVCGNKKGMFPVPFVKPIDYPTLYED